MTLPGYQKGITSQTILVFYKAEQNKHFHSKEIMVYLLKNYVEICLL